MSKRVTVIFIAILAVILTPGGAGAQSVGRAQCRACVPVTPSHEPEPSSGSNLRLGGQILTGAGGLLFVFSAALFGWGVSHRSDSSGDAQIAGEGYGTLGMVSSLLLIVPGVILWCSGNERANRTRRHHQVALLPGPPHSSGISFSLAF
jgi:hypothetical protein